MRLKLYDQTININGLSLIVLQLRWSRTPRHLFIHISCHLPIMQLTIGGGMVSSHVLKWHNERQVLENGRLTAVFIGWKKLVSTGQYNSGLFNFEFLTSKGISSSIWIGLDPSNFLNYFTNGSNMKFFGASSIIHAFRRHIFGNPGHNMYSKHLKYLVWCIEQITGNR